MKKHPVDKLFADKLKDFEMKPSDKAWERLHGNSGKNGEVKIFLYWGAAAVVLFTLGGYLWLQQNSLYTTPAIVENIQAEVPADHISQIPFEGDKKNIVSESEIDAAKVVAEENFSVNEGTQLSKLDGDKLPVIEKGIALSVTKLSNSNSSGILVDQKSIQESTHQQLTLKTHDENAVHEVAANREAVVESTNFETGEVEEKIAPRIIVATVLDNPSPPTDSEEVHTRKKNKRIKQIFTQLKKAKKGEEVDWDEVGFNPRSLLAKVDLNNSDYQE